MGKQGELRFLSAAIVIGLLGVCFSQNYMYGIAALCLLMYTYSLAVSFVQNKLFKKTNIEKEIT